MSDTRNIYVILLNSLLERIYSFSDKNNNYKGFFTPEKKDLYKL